MLVPHCAASNGSIASVVSVGFTCVRLIPVKAQTDQEEGARADPMQPPPPPPGHDYSWQNRLLQEPPTREEWEKLRASRRADQGHQQWLRQNAAQVDQRWSEARDPEVSAGSSSSRGKGRPPTTAASSADASAQPRGTTWRKVAAARRWVQSLDSGPSFGEAKHLWYVGGRPVMASHTSAKAAVFCPVLFRFACAAGLPRAL